jgi:hypothetical protein
MTGIEARLCRIGDVISSSGSLPIYPSDKVERRG